MSTQQTDSSDSRSTLLLREWKRQPSDGELAFWTWTRDGVLLQGHPDFTDSAEYDFAPSKEHPHYKTYSRWKHLVETGAVSRGEYVILTDQGGDYFTQMISDPNWEVAYDFRVKKTKLPSGAFTTLDWYQVPIGTPTNHGELRSVGRLSASVEKTNSRGEAVISTCLLADLQIRFSTTWIAIQNVSGLPPKAEGLVFEYRGHSAMGSPSVSRNPDDLHYHNAFRIVAVEPA